MLESVWLRLQDKGGLLRRIAEHRAEREAALEQQRARREMAELADCTFRPTRVAAAAPPPPKVLPTFSPHPHQFHPSLPASPQHQGGKLLCRHKRIPHLFHDLDTQTAKQKHFMGFCIASDKMYCLRMRP